MVPKFLDKTQWPYVGMIRSYFRGLNGKAAGGSGTLIHPRVILTAGHVVFDPSRGGYPTRVDVELGGTRRITVSSTVYRTTQRWLDTDSQSLNPISAYDIGALLLSEPIAPGDAPRVNFAVTAGPNFGGLEVNVVGFPVRADIYGGLFGASSFPVVMFPNLDPFRAFYSIETLDGMSGGAVYTRDASGRILLRGVHTSIYSGAGSALRITDGIAGLIQGWVNEVGGG
jgi:V8-like Glu-specific endopeptidase